MLAIVCCYYSSLSEPSLFPTCLDLLRSKFTVCLMCSSMSYMLTAMSVNVYAVAAESCHERIYFV